MCRICQKNVLRLIHTCCSGLHIPQQTVSMKRQEFFYLSVSMQLSAAASNAACVNEPLLSQPIGAYRIVYFTRLCHTWRRLRLGMASQRLYICLMARGRLEGVKNPASDSRVDFQGSPESSCATIFSSKFSIALEVPPQLSWFVCTYLPSSDPRFEYQA